MVLPKDGVVEVTGIELCSVGDENWPMLLNLLSFEEQARAAEFRFEKHRRQHIAAHALKRLLLADATGMAPSALRFAASAAGKPRLIGPAEGLEFNLAHCEGMVACAVSRHHAVGVDVEPASRRAPLELAGRLYTAAEQAWLEGLAKAEQDAGFFTLWTLKEAFVKALGTGLQQDTRAVEFSFQPLAAAFRSDGFGAVEAWRFHSQRIGSTHLIAVAVAGGDCDLSVDLRSFEDLIRPRAG